MPVIHAHVVVGFGEDRAKKVIEGVTTVFADLGVPAENVEVFIHETPTTHIGRGGEPATV